MSLVKRLVELHHGTISVDSELGSGTIFTVELPIGDNEYSAEERAPQGTKPQLDALEAPLNLPDIPDEGVEVDTANEDLPSDSDRETLLVVDDNPDILKYLCESLSEHYNVVPAADGAKAIQILSGSKRRFDYNRHHDARYRRGTAV